jgi:hypothetical protein
MRSVKVTQHRIEHDKIRKRTPHPGAHEKCGVCVGEASRLTEDILRLTGNWAFREMWL